MFIKNDLAICDVVADIEEGKYDDKLQQMKAEFDTVFRRRQIVLANEITIGDRIKITGNMKPKYLTGVTGTVLSKDRKGFWVQMDKDHPNLAGRKYENYGEVGLPLGCVSKIEA
tara:strand:+ start:1307 stop:1648 length:342 start_codon:yes stop_codon:yes gene_type:complete